MARIEPFEPKRQKPTPIEEKYEQKGATFFAEVSRRFNHLLGSLADNAVRQSKAPSLRQGHIIAPHQVEELIRDAKGILESLKKFKEELIAEYGVTSSAFIARSIDRMIEQTIQTIDEFKHTRATSNQYTKRAVNLVALYEQLSDEKKLQARIVREAIIATQEAIEQDIEILLDYNQQKLREVGFGQSQRLKQELDEKLQPIFNQFHELALSIGKMRDAELHEFFRSKIAIDEKRSNLTEQGLRIVDSYIRKVLILPTMPETTSFTEKEITELVLLEQEAFKLYDFLQASIEETTTPETFKQFDQMIADLKTQVEDLYEISTQKPDFDNILQKISDAEELLEQTQNQIIAAIEESKDTTHESEYFS